MTVPTYAPLLNPYDFYSEGGHREESLVDSTRIDSIFLVIYVD